MFVCIGIAGVLSGLAKFAVSIPKSTVLPIAGCAALALGLLWIGLRIKSSSRFIGYLVSTWLLSRALVVLLFPRYVLPGDETYFHSFVGKLIVALANGNIAALSNIYDYPVWLSRSFPFYLPLALAFGESDVLAARYMNVGLGAIQLVLLFFIARMAGGSRVARLACLLLLVFPYYWINVLSYDPQIAGTFFLLIALLAFLNLLRRNDYSVARLTLLGSALGVSLLFAGVQRGGIDLLLVGVMFIAVLLLTSFPDRRMRPRSLMTLILAVGLLWFPCRTAISYWISSHDTYRLRSHTLGFMTRGWNLETNGEYLPLYEQLDVVTPRPEKKRILEAVLVTEFAREPRHALAALPIVKIAKLLAVGYASTAETGLDLAGYTAEVNIYKGLRSLYAPVVLSLCGYGLLLSLTRRKALLRLMTPVLLMTVSCIGIVLFWETSPRYSHPFHFVIVILAAAGISGLRKSDLQTARTALKPVAAQTLALALSWSLLAVGMAFVCRAFTPYILVDPRSLMLKVNNEAKPISAINPMTVPWEGVIEIPPQTSLPARVEISLPTAPKRHFAIYLWLLPDILKPFDPKYKVGIDGFAELPPASTGRIVRAIGTGINMNVGAADGSKSVLTPLRVGVGFILAE